MAIRPFDLNTALRRLMLQTDAVQDPLQQLRELAAPARQFYEPRSVCLDPDWSPLVQAVIHGPEFAAVAEELKTCEDLEMYAVAQLMLPKMPELLRDQILGRWGNVPAWHWSSHDQLCLYLDSRTEVSLDRRVRPLLFLAMLLDRHMDWVPRMLSPSQYRICRRLNLLHRLMNPKKH